jgi:hypothetical protein
MLLFKSTLLTSTKTVKSFQDNQRLLPSLELFVLPVKLTTL